MVLYGNRRNSFLNWHKGSRKLITISCVMTSRLLSDSTLDFGETIPSSYSVENFGKAQICRAKEDCEAKRDISTALF